MTKHLLLFAVLLFASSSLAADVEYSTTGADVFIEELGWPCGGWWAQFWYVWITCNTREVIHRSDGINRRDNP